MIRVIVIATIPMALVGLQAMLISPDVDIITSTLEDIDFDSVDADVIVTTEDQKVDLIINSLRNTQAMSLVILSNDVEQTFTTLRDSDLHGWGILPLSTSPAQLHATVIATSQGLVTYPSRLLDQPSNTKVMTGISSLRPDNSSIVNEKLTSREREVLELVGQGLSNKLIARSLHISDHTVKFHISSITTKLGASSRTDAVRLGLYKGLITL